MTETLHKNIPIADNHSFVKYSQSTAAGRRALTGCVRGEVCEQTDTVPATLWAVVTGGAGTATWSRIDTGAEAVGPTGTDYGALGIAQGLSLVGYFRADYGVSGTAGSGKALWAPIAGTMSAMTPDGTATNGIGSVSAGLGGRAGLLTNGASQMSQYTAPALVAPGTTNWHRYWLQKQLSPGSGAVRKVFDDAGSGYKVEYSTATNLAAYGCGVAAATNQDVWQRCRISYTGSGTSEIKWGNGTATSGGSASNTVPGTARTFGNLVWGVEALMYLEFTGTKANFLTFCGLADTAIQTDWGTIQV